MPPRRRASEKQEDPASENFNRGSIKYRNIQISKSSPCSLFVAFVLILLISFSYTALRFLVLIRTSQDWPSWMAIQPQPTLVIYVYSGSDPEYLNNLKFFIKEAIQVSFTGAPCYSFCLEATYFCCRESKFSPPPKELIIPLNPRTFIPLSITSTP